MPLGLAEVELPGVRPIAKRTGNISTGKPIAW
jgi:hypothetical protein